MWLFNSHWLKLYIKLYKRILLMQLDVEKIKNSVKHLTTAVDALLDSHAALIKRIDSLNASIDEARSEKGLSDDQVVMIQDELDTIASDAEREAARVENELVPPTPVPDPTPDPTPVEPAQEPAPAPQEPPKSEGTS